MGYLVPIEYGMNLKAGTKLRIRPEFLNNRPDEIYTLVANKFNIVSSYDILCVSRNNSLSHQTLLIKEVYLISDVPVTPEFCKGDIVECVDSKNWNSITKGKQYEVIDHDFWLHVKDDGDELSGWYPYQFKKVVTNFIDVTDSWNL